MTGRNMLPSDNTQKPGPGAHSPEKVGASFCLLFILWKKLFEQATLYFRVVYKHHGYIQLFSMLIQFNLFANHLFYEGKYSLEEN